MKDIIIYTDGACSQNKSWKGGWGVVLIYKDNYIKTFSGNCEETTNSRMEIQAVLEGLKRLKEPCNVKIISDSAYVCNTINEWLDKWIKEGNFESKANLDQWREYLELRKIHNVVAEHIRGHRGIYYNEIADKLATNAIKGDVVSE